MLIKIFRGEKMQVVLKTHKNLNSQYYEHFLALSEYQDYDRSEKKNEICYCHGPPQLASCWLRPS